MEIYLAKKGKYSMKFKAEAREKFLRVCALQILALDFLNQCCPIQV